MGLGRSLLSEAGVSVEEANALILKIGNLALLSGRKKREASNKPFSMKQRTYATSEITMTRDLKRFDKWGREEIEQRSNELAELAVRIYPHPCNITVVR